MVSSRFLENALGGKETEASEESQAISSEQEAADNRQEQPGMDRRIREPSFLQTCLPLWSPLCPLWWPLPARRYIRAIILAMAGFWRPQTYEVPSSGSGIIVGENEKELLIVTNNHVVEASTP